MKHIACTISSENYAKHVKVWAESLFKADPGIELWWLVVDRKSSMLDMNIPQLNILYVEELPIGNINELAFIYSLVEFNTNVKPTFLKWLFNEREANIVTYFDPDIQFFSNLERLKTMHLSADVVLTPHALSSTPKSFPIEDRLFLKTGVFNLGFISLARSKQSDELLNWWEDRCLAMGFTESSAGVFVDQKWINLSIAHFDRVMICRDAGLNVAYWNLYERELLKERDNYCVNGSELMFFHFSGFDSEQPERITTHAEGLYLKDFPTSRDLFTNYEQALNVAKTKVRCRTEYSYATFEDGRDLNDIVRKLYIGFADGGDPFVPKGDWKSFLNRSKLVGKSLKIGKVNPQNVNRSDWRLLAINRGLRITAKWVGGGRYEALLKYLSYITTPRNQNYVFGAPGIQGKVRLEVSYSLRKGSSEEAPAEVEP